MSKMWRIVLYAAAALLGLGLVLLGAGWLTGGSVSRITELVFGGPEELRVWFHDGLNSIQSMLSALFARIQALF